MKQIFFLMTFVTLSACAQVPVKEVETVSMTISPGEVRWLDFPLKGRDVRLNCKGLDLKFEVKGAVGRTVVVENYFSNRDPFKCDIYSEGIVYHQINFKVKKREYKTEKLNVPLKTIKLSRKDEERVKVEQEMLNKIYASSLKNLQFERAFIQPMLSTITSIYGTKRLYNNRKEGQHLGIDYRAAIGDKVPTANRGKVVFAGDLFYTGGTVIIDHGLDIFTVYGHLSQTLVIEGDIVERGQLIGLSGNTGRTSGPHLHWGVKVQGDYIDGLVLIDETKKYLSE